MLRKPIRLQIARADTSVIGAGDLLHYHFELPDRSCTGSGRIIGLAGGKKDFYAAIMDDNGFRNFSTNHESRVFWQSTPQTAAATIATQLQGPGLYHLVVSNHFSAFSSKNVEVSAELICP